MTARPRIGSIVVFSSAANDETWEVIPTRGSGIAVKSNRDGRELDGVPFENVREVTT